MPSYLPLVPEATMWPYLDKWQKQSGFSPVWGSLISKGFDKWSLHSAVDIFLHSSKSLMELFNISEGGYRLIRHYMLQDGLIHKVIPPTVGERKVDIEPRID